MDIQSNEQQLLRYQAIAGRNVYLRACLVEAISEVRLLQGDHSRSVSEARLELWSRAAVPDAESSVPDEAMTRHADGRDGEREESSAVRAALTELVAVKDLKERLERLHEMGQSTDYAQYHRRQPLAWAAARAALTAPVQQAVAPAAPTEGECSAVACWLRPDGDGLSPAECFIVDWASNDTHELAKFHRELSALLALAASTAPSKERERLHILELETMAANIRVRDDALAKARERYDKLGARYDALAAASLTPRAPDVKAAEP